MTLLEESRIKIDQIDEQITKLFEERMHAVEGVIEYKKQNNMPIFDASRESAIIQKNLNRLNDAKLEKYFVDFYQHMMDVSKNYQKAILEEDK